MRVTVDAGRCACCGGCADLVPQVFRIVGYDLRVVDPDPPEDLRAVLLEAEELCPTSAIKISATGGRAAGDTQGVRHGD